MSNWLSRDKRMLVVDGLMNGQSVRQIAASVGVSKVTVSGYRKLIQAAEWLGDDARLPTCPCGQPSGHRGWCRERYSKSLKRQKFMKDWKSK